MVSPVKSEVAAMVSVLVLPVITDEPKRIVELSLTSKDALAKAV